MKPTAHRANCGLYLSEMKKQPLESFWLDLHTISKSSHKEDPGGDGLTSIFHKTPKELKVLILNSPPENKNSKREKKPQLTLCG